mmetsp:Transcript_14849/g.46250  ORF Transcript_14849/g.46250 Transcript_14849/m.46250 type:complete len:242 (-) Transcript_14849:692-1417(-)
MPSPRGNEPVLFSRSANSMVLSADSIADSPKPSFAMRSSASITSASTLGTSASATPFRPIEKVGWRSSSDRPPPMTDSPRPDSSSALRSGAADVPSSSWSRISHTSASSVGMRSSDSTQLVQSMCWFLGVPSPASSETVKVRVWRRGSSNKGCVAMLESISRRSNWDKYSSSRRRRSCTGSSPENHRRAFDGWYSVPWKFMKSSKLRSGMRSGSPPESTPYVLSGKSVSCASRNITLSGCE